MNARPFDGSRCRPETVVVQSSPFGVKGTLKMTTPIAPSIPIRSITPRGLLSFGPDTPPLELRPLNVLIGPNASGKSNLLDLLMLVRSLPSDMQAPIRGRGGIEGWVWKGAVPNSGPSTDPFLELIAFPFGHSKSLHHRLVFDDGDPFETDFWVLSEAITDGDGILYQSNLPDRRIHMRSGNGALVDTPYHEQHRLGRVYTNVAHRR